MTEETRMKWAAALHVAAKYLMDGADVDTGVEEILAITVEYDADGKVQISYGVGGDYVS